MLVFQIQVELLNAEIKGGQLTAMRQRDEDNKTDAHALPSSTVDQRGCNPSFISVPGANMLLSREL